MKRKVEITTDKLARMIERGFASIETRMATNRDLLDLREETRTGFHKVNGQINEIKEELHLIWAAVNRIEKEILEDHARRIERLETKLGIR